MSSIVHSKQGNLRAQPGQLARRPIARETTVLLPRSDADLRVLATAAAGVGGCGIAQRVAR